MALITFASAKGAPGVSTLAVLVAALWPRPVLLADCDPAGGDIAVRMPSDDGGRLDPDRGLVSLAAVGRHGLAPGQIRNHVQTLSGGLDVLAGAATPEQAAAMAPLWRDIGGCLDTLHGVDVIADCGRLGPVRGGGGPTSTLPLLRASRLVVLVCRPDLSSVVHLRDRLTLITELLRPEAADGVAVGVVVVAPAGEDRAVDGVRDVVARDHPAVVVIGQLAFDPKAAAFFAGAPTGRIDRSMLIRSGRALAARIAHAVEPFWVPSADADGRAPRSPGEAQSAPARAGAAVRGHAPRPRPRPDHEHDHGLVGGGGGGAIAGRAPAPAPTPRPGPGGQPNPGWAAPPTTPPPGEPGGPPGPGQRPGWPPAGPPGQPGRHPTAGPSAAVGALGAPGAAGAPGHPDTGRHAAPVGGGRHRPGAPRRDPGPADEPEHLAQPGPVPAWPAPASAWPAPASAWPSPPVLPPTADATSEGPERR